jgi:hypothetical protein
VSGVRVPPPACCSFAPLGSRKRKRRSLFLGRSASVGWPRDDGE